VTDAAPHSEVDISTSTILLVDDNPQNLELMQAFLEELPCTIQTASDGIEAIEKIERNAPILLILDVMMPKLSGFDVCKQLRSAGHDIPIIMLTARGQEIDKVMGLKTGADDYVTKPFSFLELMARVEAVLRRSQRTEKLTAYQFGAIALDF